MSKQDEAILEFTVRVTAKASEETKALINDLKAAKNIKKDAEESQHERAEKLKDDVDAEQEDQGDEFKRPTGFEGTSELSKEGVEVEPEVEEAIREAVYDTEEDAINAKIEKKVKPDIDDKVKEIDEKIKKLGKLAQNPIEELSDMIEALLPAKAKTIIKILLAGGATYAIAVEIIKILSMKGGPLNRDWRRMLSEEIDAGLSREMQKRRELGLDQVILTQQKGFVKNNENWTYNSLYNVDKSRLSRIGLSDRAAGVIV